jgi:ATP-dependent Clp protease protease subunit
MAEIIARHSNRDVEQVMLDIDRDKFMSPPEAVEYGLIDEVIPPRLQASAATRAANASTSAAPTSAPSSSS